MNKMRLLLYSLGVLILGCVRHATGNGNYLSENEQKRGLPQITSINIDDACRSQYGNNSYLCREQYKTGYDYICDSLYCFDALTLKICMFSIPPQDSTLCGNGKWCQTHHCIQDQHAQVTTDSCPLGDSKRSDITLGMSCSEIVTKRPSFCYDDRIGKTWCCGSCSNITKPVPATFTGPTISADDDCKELFGDTSYFCQTDKHYTGNDFTATCHNLYCFNPGNGNCEPYPASDGVPCGNGKWCVGGNCSASPLASVNPITDCLYGNQFETFCHANIVYPNIATYCSQYEAGCCSTCFKLKNTSAKAGCEYGDRHPVTCKQHIQAKTINSYCHTNEADCCQTCADLEKGGDAACPFGDVSAKTCADYMVDRIGPGNCYSQTHQQECCDTCPRYFNASKPKGCEYGDHWKDYCIQNVAPPNVAKTCEQYEHQCCDTCAKYKALGFPGCVYGDQDPMACEALMKTEIGTANCYNIADRRLCCATCDKLKDSSTPGCLYGDTKPSDCTRYFNDSLGYGNCYDLRAQIDCCRSCAKVRNDSNKGCEFGDHQKDFCAANVLNRDSAFLCFQYEGECCETCGKYKLSDIQDCKYGDKTPIVCKFRITDESQAAALCPTLGVSCCATCSKYGHPGPAGSIPKAQLVG